MERIDTKLPGVSIIHPHVIGDHRGYFIETYSSAKFADMGLDFDFVQDNQSYTQKKGTIRGIHFQNHPMAQCKVIRVIRGAIIDVAVDLRRGSPMYRMWIGIELSEENRYMLLIPRGFGHGFLTLTDDVECCYKVDKLYSKEHDRGIHFDDPDIGIRWGVTNPILSEKDRSSPFLKDSDCNFIYEEERK